MRFAKLFSCRVNKGDLYLKTACCTICKVFKHSPVFRIGGDEFAVILQNADYCNMESLIEKFDATANTINASTAEPWKQVWISKGFTVFQPSEDSAVIDVMHRADSLMYENKRDRKTHGKTGLLPPSGR